MVAQPAIAGLIAELSLPAFAQSSEGDMIFERLSREGPQPSSAADLTRRYRASAPTNSPRRRRSDRSAGRKQPSRRVNESS